ncbi:MAG TPA: urea ABC transporter permease subunit UrtB [Steroidobacteraceae bacterium]|nr:urea ABC transporter permease subunit UrtB [Steroidobacteraceae bacterium]
MNIGRSAVVGALLTIVVLASSRAHAGPLEDGVQGLAATDDDKLVEALRKLAALDDARAWPALDALCDDRLKVASDGRVYVYDSKTRDVRDPITLAVVSPAPAGLKDVEVSNEVRRVANPVLAQLKLSSSVAADRLAAAEELSKGGDEDAAVMLHKALDKERDPKVHDALALAVARIDLHGTNVDAKVAALGAVAKSANDEFLADVKHMLTKTDDGKDVEPDPRVRAAAQAAVNAIESHQRLITVLGSLLHGISLASVLLFAALGLAVTFGLLGVINMAHGEMLMLGAYSTYAVQQLFLSTFPGALRWYLIVAIPVAFVVTAVVGMILERGVIRFLYGRPLETLLATWGISLGLIQTVRLIFGAQNVSVANPDWLSGGVEIAQGLVLPWSRVGVVAFCIVVAAGVWFLLQRTRLGLYVRAVTQNRAMAACMGISTKRIDTMMFGLGSGIAGLGGVALSQLGNVGPELGQGYIIDSFMVVVLGGVGRLAGAVAAAFGLGVVNKILEPLAGAVTGKIVVLTCIILFIQRRPQGLFAIKGRVEA